MHRGLQPINDLLANVGVNVGAMSGFALKSSQRKKEKKDKEKRKRASFSPTLSCNDKLIQSAHKAAPDQSEDDEDDSQEAIVTANITSHDEASTHKAIKT